MLDFEMFGKNDGFINLVRHEFTKEWFERQAKMMLGEDWRVEGLKVLEDESPELVEKFKVKYGSN